MPPNFRKEYVVVLIFYFLFLSANLYSLNPQKVLTQYKLETWSVEQGFEQNIIYTIIQDNNGFLWLGTVEGLVRFDGVHFKVFNKQNTPQLKGNEVRALYQGDDGTLWIGTTGGLTCLRNGEFFGIPDEPGSKLEIITSIIEDVKGNVWVGCKFGGAGKVENDTLVPVIGIRQLQSDKIYTILKDKEGNIWFGSSGGLTKSTVSGQLIEYGEESGLRCSNIFALCETNDGRIWIGTNEGLFCFQEKEGRFSRYCQKQGLPDTKVISLLEDRDGNLWGGTDGGGLIRINNGKIEVLSPIDDKIPTNVYAICEDREGSLWLGTIKIGLQRLRDTHFTTITTDEGLAHDSVKCLYEEKDGTILIGTEGGVNRLINGEITPFLSMDNGLHSHSLTGITKSTDGSLWIGFSDGLQRYRNGKFDYFSINDGLLDDHVVILSSDQDGGIWISTTNGLSRYFEGDFHNFSEQYPKLENVFINSIYETRDGSLLLGGGDGSLYHYRGGVFKNPVAPLERAIKSSIESLYEDSDGVIYIGTRSGLVRFKGDVLTNYTIHGGLVDSFVSGIFEDDEGNFWLSGRTGISRVSKKDLEDFAEGKIDQIRMSTYNEEDGMESRYCVPYGIKSKDGKLWIPTFKGLVLIEPEKIKINELPPPVVIEEVTVDGEQVETKHFLSAFKNGNELVIAPGKRRIEFHYTALSYIKPQKLLFKLKLDGYDKDWIEVGNTRSNTYTALSYGHYTFRVIACNSDGVWNEDGASFSFYVQPYFYQTTGFYIGCLLAVALITFLVFRLRIRQLKARQKELSRLVDIRTQALNERTVQLEKAHDYLRQSKEIIEEKNRNILDSIKYARKIQVAILPTDGRLKDVIQDSFVLFKPRDIVSGDFYWFSEVGSKMYIAVVDCTGHGVPGALLSMIGNMKLNEIVDENIDSEPAQLLLKLHAGVRQSLQQEQESSDSDDGMDVALCMIDKVKGKISFAGARRPLFCVTNGELTEVKGSRDPIGGRKKNKNPKFINHLIEINENTILYLTSDGFADQCNNKNKKYGSARLKRYLQSISHLSMPQQKQLLNDELARHQGEEEQRDDITIIGLKLR